MKCPNCGAEMKETSLYCESCGNDIHIVPDFEPEVEYNLQQAFSDIIKEIAPPVEPIPIPEDEMQDWDGLIHSKSGSRRRKILGILLGVLLVIGIIGGAIAVAWYRHSSLDFQVMRAQYYAEDEQYERAIAFYSRALELEPDSIELKFALAEVYFLKNNKIEYEYLLRDIVKDKNATVEQLESAYGKLIAIYRAREDYQTINKLLLASGDESIISMYQNYIAKAPEFSVKEGTYSSIQPLKLTNFGTGRIYYTTDGSEPNESSQLYTAPILLEEGEYCIKAVYINEMGIVSEVAVARYFIEIEALPTPVVLVDSGDYEYPTRIEVIYEGEEIYYTTDGTEPTISSNRYTGPIPMPLGVSTFKFIRIEDGRSSDVVECIYNLELNTQFTVEQAVRTVIEYAMSIEKIYDEEGHFDESQAVYKYEFRFAANINGVSDFYVIAEYIGSADGSLERTGNYFAVDIYTGKLYKLQINDTNNYLLVEIEKEARE